MEPVGRVHVIGVDLRQLRHLAYQQGVVTRQVEVGGAEVLTRHVAHKFSILGAHRTDFTIEIREKYMFSLHCYPSVN